MFPRLRSFLTAWARREPFEDALDEEVRFHLEACTEEPVRAGVPRCEAARRARVRDGSTRAGTAAAVAVFAGGGWRQTVMVEAFEVRADCVEDLARLPAKA